ncbi:MAG: helix-turn-helix transcriptional regulator [Saprospiraceae bacterium]
MKQLTILAKKIEALTLEVQAIRYCMESPSVPGNFKDSDLLTKQEVAALLSVSLSSINVYMKNGTLKPLHFGTGKRKIVRFRRSDVQLLISQKAA